MRHIRWAVPGVLVLLLAVPAPAATSAVGLTEALEEAGSQAGQTADEARGTASGTAEETALGVRSAVESAPVPGPQEEADGEPETSEDPAPSPNDREEDQASSPAEDAPGQEDDPSPGPGDEDAAAHHRGHEDQLFHPLLFGYTPGSGPRSTLDIIRALGPGADTAAVAQALAPFPVAGPAGYSDDWHAPRYGPGPVVRRHKGTDIFAARSTPVIASFDGVVGRLTTNARLSGISLRLTLADGTYFFYAHLDGFGPGIREGARVSRGQVIGYVGNTGNAIGTPPHLHFQVHPRGGDPVSPLPYLDTWLQGARHRLGITGVAMPPAPGALAAGSAEVEVFHPALSAAQRGMHGPTGGDIPVRAGAAGTRVPAAPASAALVAALALAVVVVLTRRRASSADPATFREGARAPARGTRELPPPGTLLQPRLRSSACGHGGRAAKFSRPLRVVKARGTQQAVGPRCPKGSVRPPGRARRRASELTRSYRSRRSDV